MSEPDKGARIRRLAALARRKLAGACDLDPFTRAAFLVILGYLEQGAIAPRQEVLATEASMTPRELQRCTGKLSRAGLLFVVRNGSAPATYHLGAVLEDWLGDLTVESPDTTVSRIDPATGVVPRARAFQAAGGAVQRDGATPAGVAADAAAERELDDLEQRAVAALRSNGIPMPYTMRLRLRRWLARGLQLDDVRVAGDQAALNGAKGSVTWREF